MLISAPDDYGLTEDQTLAHTVTGSPPAEFDDYWSDFDEEVAALSTHWVGSIDAPVNEVVIPSIRAVRVVARVAMPDGAVRGIVVTTHGSGAADVFPEPPEPWTAEGLVTVRLRVRGYPPSTLDVDDLRAGWILHRFPSVDAWIARGAIADVVQACRCARRHFGAAVPIALHGESLGGALAVIAAARLPGYAEMGDTPSRLAIGLPSFGDWRWREDRYCNGSGGLINDYFVAARDDRDAPRRALLLFDSAFHARVVVCPVLCKLALRDDVVPAPSAAAVYNALGSRDRWRFVTRFGHFDGGVADLRRHLWFDRLHPRFLDPRVEPSAVAAEIEDFPSVVLNA